MSPLAYCQCCGAPRGLAAPRAALSIHDLLFVKDHKDVAHPAGFIVEQSPQLIASLQVYRNGGGLEGREHICDDCLLIGLRHIRQQIDALIPPQEATP